MSADPAARAPKMRILHPRLAAIVATLRHGEMIFVSDAGSGTSPKAVVPLDPGVEYIDLGVVTGVPSFKDVVGALCEVGDFEGAIVSSGMGRANPDCLHFLEGIFGEELVHKIPYFPDFYPLRDRVKVMVQTGDYGVGANAFLIGGYPSPNIPLEWLRSSAWFDELVRSGGQLVNDGTSWTRAASDAPEGED